MNEDIVNSVGYFGGFLPKTILMQSAGVLMPTSGVPPRGAALPILVITLSRDSIDKEAIQAVPTAAQWQAGPKEAPLIHSCALMGALLSFPADSSDSYHPLYYIDTHLANPSAVACKNCRAIVPLIFYFIC